VKRITTSSIKLRLKHEFTVVCYKLVIRYNKGACTGKTLTNTSYLGLDFRNSISKPYNTIFITFVLSNEKKINQIRPLYDT